MGGKSETSQTQQSTTAPWATAQPALNGILGQVQTGLNNTGLTGAETGAIGTLENNAGSANRFAPAIQSSVAGLLDGGGATDQSGNFGQTLQDYIRRLAPTADGSLVGANSALRPHLDQIATDVSNTVNPMFAAAGRDFSGANFNALARGIASGEAPVIASQFNTDTANARSAADALFNGGNTSGGLLADLQQRKVGNQVTGAGMVPAAIDAPNAGANATLAAEAARRGIPIEALGLLAKIGVPIASLGSQTSGQSTGTQQMSGADQFLKIAGGLGSLFGAATGAKSAGTGLAGLLGPAAGG
jgi:hypothetical protein